MPSGPTSTSGQCLREHCCANSGSIRRKLLVLKIKAEMPPRICKSKLTFQLLDLIWARRGVCGLPCEWKHRISWRETLDLAAFPPGGSEPLLRRTNIIRWCKRETQQRLTTQHNSRLLRRQGEVREVVAQDTVQADHAGRCCWHQQATRPARLAGSFHQSQGWFSARPPPAGPPAPGPDGLVQTWRGASWESLASCHQLLFLCKRLLRFCLELQRVYCVRTGTWTTHIEHRIMHKQTQKCKDNIGGVH